MKAEPGLQPQIFDIWDLGSLMPSSGWAEHPKFESELKRPESWPKCIHHPGLRRLLRGQRWQLSIWKNRSLPFAPPYKWTCEE